MRKLSGGGYNHPFVNVKGIYARSLFYGAKKRLNKWARTQSDKPKIAIAYSLTRYTLKAMNYLKSLNPAIITAIIVPDLPQYTYGYTENKLKNYYNKLSRNSILKVIKCFSRTVDKWILFSEKMREELPCIRSWMTMEGIAVKHENIQDGYRFYDSSKKEIIYAGGLNRLYGVDKLIEAFSLLQGNKWRLIIAGDGEFRKNIEEIKDPRIQYLGRIPIEHLWEIERGADILVNPRGNSGIFTRYSFPSKNMEYLVAGVPTVGFKLEGIPDEYDQFINYCPEDTAEALADTLKKIGEDKTGTYANKALLGQKFVLENKNNIAWAEKIMNFLINQ